MAFIVIMDRVTVVKSLLISRPNGDLNMLPVKSHFPSCNGLVEKAVQTVKNIISKSIESGTDPYLGLLAQS